MCVIEHQEALLLSECESLDVAVQQLKSLHWLLQTMPQLVMFDVLCLRPLPQFRLSTPSPQPRLPSSQNLKLKLRAEPN